jgi:hypothetical protein
MAPTILNLAEHGIRTQALGDVLAGISGNADGARWNVWLGWTLVVGLAVFVFASRDFRTSFDNILGGAVVGLAVVGGWYLTGGALGQEWKEFADMSATPPSRVEVQSYTFISPMADSLHYLTDPKNLSLINFGIMAFVGVIAGSALYAALSRNFHVEWFANGRDFLNHAAGGALMGTGGVLAMGCTVGQAITGVSTLAVGSIMTFGAIVAGSAATMKYQYWRMMRED